jgi:hypothetical protein
MSIEITLLSIASYFFIGGALNGFLREHEYEDGVHVVLLWPIVICTWIGNEFGKLIGKFTK